MNVTFPTDIPCIWSGESKITYSLNPSIGEAIPSWLSLDNDINIVAKIPNVNISYNHSFSIDYSAQGIPYKVPVTFEVIAE